MERIECLSPQSLEMQRCLYALLLNQISRNWRTALSCWFQNCEEDDERLSSSLETSKMQCRHVTANYYVNPPWMSPNHRLLPCPPVPPPPPTRPGAALPCPAVYCPMDGTVRRLDLTSPPAAARLSPDDAAVTAYVPMNIYKRVATGSLPRPGSDVIDECAVDGDNIYEPLNDFDAFENNEE